MSDKLIYRNFNYTLADVQLVKDCFEKNDLSKDIKQLEWLYLNAPGGEMELQMAMENNEIASMYALFPVKFKYGNKLVKVLQSLDTLTNLNYRGKGLFKKLSTSSYNNCKEKGYEFVYGFPNGNSAHGFFNKLGWKKQGKVPFLILPNSVNYFLKRIPLLNKIEKLLPTIRLFKKKINNNDCIKSITKFENEATEVWNKFSLKHDVSINRDAEYLNWRFLEKPNENYQIKGYYYKNVLEGFIVYTFKEKHGGRVGYIMELIYNPIFPEIGKDLLKFAKNDLFVNKIDVCLAWCFKHSESFKIFRSQYFFIMPKILRPIELHFGYKKLVTEDDNCLDSLKNWYLSYADSDTV